MVKKEEEKENHDTKIPSCHLNSHTDRIRHTMKTQPNSMPRKTLSFKKYIS